MALQVVEAGSRLRLERGQAVVCIPVFNAADHFARCLTSVATHAGEATQVLIADDASTDPAIERIARDVGERFPDLRLAYRRNEENLGFVRNLNNVFAMTAPADVVILNSDCVVTEGWLDGMRDAAYSDSRVATVSSLTNHGTILSFPHRNSPQPSLPQDWVLDELAFVLGYWSARMRPRIPTAIGHCLYIRRSALELVGPFDEAFSPGYEEEVDFAQRCVINGLIHVVADEVFVLHEGGGSFGEGAQALQREHFDIVRARYPYYEHWVEQVARDELSPLAQTLARNRRAVGVPFVTIDGRCLTQFVTGTQVHTLEVIAALARFASLRLRVIVPPDLGDYARSLLSDLPEVELLPADEVRAGMELSDVFHRPFQVSSAGDLDIARIVGRRLVITHQDLIGFHNPGYFATFRDWRDLQRLTRAAMAAADRVLFFSYHAARDALAEQLVDEAQSRVVYIGTDHRLVGLRPQPTQPPGTAEIGDRPLLLCLGTDFRHKNRRFAMRLLSALRREHGWDGDLVLAGAHVSTGWSTGDEVLEDLRDESLEGHVHDVAAVTEAEKVWLLERATAVVYPTVAEGFGLVPFEAADAGLPCLFAPGTSLTEILPSETASLVPWDPGASAESVLPLLVDEERRVEHVRAIRQAGARFTWRRTALGLEQVYREAADAPTRPTASIALDQVELQARLEATQREVDRVEEAMPELQGKVHRLQSIEQLFGEPTLRALIGIAYNPVLRRIVLAPIRLLYRIVGGRSAAAEQPETEES